MHPTNPDSSLPAIPLGRRILLLYGGLAIASFTASYLSGALRFYALPLPWPFVSWAGAAAIALVIEYGRRLCIPLRNGRGYRMVFLVPALIQIGQDITSLDIGRTTGERVLVEAIYFLLANLDVIVIFFGVRLLHAAYRTRIAPIDVQLVSSETAVPPENTSPAQNFPSTLLGRGDGYIDRVIRSVTGRSIKSENMASISLIVMMILVIAGGMASFGLWALTHADRISTLEAERNKLISLQSDVKEVRDKLNASEDVKAHLDRLNKFIDQNYSTSESYKEALNRLSLQSQTNYADIAIRVTIAVLTIFLVQVFFAVYKYNRHLAIMLAAKAEALELAGNDDDARKELSREAVNIIKESVPGFAPYLRTPIEEATRMVEKLGKTK